MTATPLILQTASVATVHQAALMYESAGLSVLACRGKRPALSNWNHLQERRADPATINLWQRVGLLENVGIICGAVSGNLVVMDCDGIGAINFFRSQFPSLVDYTHHVMSGSGKGGHFYFYVDELPPTTRLINYPTPFGIINLELRSNGTYVVAPPSIHPVTGHAYTIGHHAPILRLPDMTAVVEWLKALMLEKHGGVMPPAAGKPKQVKDPSAFGRAALAGECASVRMAAPGARNNTLYRAALKLGSLVADGKLDRLTVETDLAIAAAALIADEGEQSVRRTITSGLKQGELSSRERFKSSTQA